MISVAETLRQARGLISEPGTWCIKYLQQEVVVNGHHVRQHCAIGAVHTVGGNWMDALHALKVAATRRGSGGHGWDTIAFYNNSHTHAEVLSMFDEAIADAEAAEAPKPLPDCLTAKIMIVPERELVIA